jgi:ElaB/YqjD/DUF883 family membrane-anchored ribosome-binding protein
MGTEDYKASEEIEGEIEHTRSEMRETLDAIQRRLTPGQIMDEVVTYFRQGPGAFASNLGRTVRDNPIPVALVGAGLAWLAMSGSRRRLSRDGQDADDEAQYYYASAGGGDYAAAAGAEQAAYASTGGTYHPGPAASGSTHRPTGGETGEYGSGTSHGFSSSSYGAYEEEESRQGRIGRMAGGARERMSRIGGMAREQGQRARSGFTEMVDEQPLLMAAAAFVLGAALGALMPTTRREDRLMGETRDDLAHRAAEKGRAGIERAGQAVGETWTAVSDEMLQRESSSGGEAGATPAERNAAHMTERMSEGQGPTAAGLSSSAGNRTASPSTSDSSTVKSGGAAGSTPSEGDKKKG